MKFFIFTLLGVLLACYDTNRAEKTEKAPKHVYVKGEILLPDYAHTDTLIVVFPNTLNFLFDDALATDQEISDHLMLGCELYSEYRKKKVYTPTVAKDSIIKL